LVGPDCRTLLEKYAAILAYISEKIKAAYGDIEAADIFFAAPPLLRHRAACARERRHAAGHEQRRRRAAERGQK